jgi:hypothetical protein
VPMLNSLKMSSLLRPAIPLLAAFKVKVMYLVTKC